MTGEPTTELDPRYSSEGAVATPWVDTERVLREAGAYWISTVRLDWRPHVTPLVGVWHDGAIYFTTGPGERKAMNLKVNPNCVLTTGSNEWNSGSDVVVEGVARLVDEDSHLQRIADAFREKYGEEWSFQVRDGFFFHDEGGRSLVFRVSPVTVFGFGKGDPFSQTRYRFLS